MKSYFSVKVSARHWRIINYFGPSNNENIHCNKILKQIVSKTLCRGNLTGGCGSCRWTRARDWCSRVMTCHAEPRHVMARASIKNRQFNGKNVWPLYKFLSDTGTMAHHLEPSDNEEIHDDGHYLVTIWPNSDQIVTKQ